mmetsp:Transcript_8499/g.12099  ORF Transcript_8499/g.12099 Transcript_8499/m.12099 type:complete len:144 (+) Transcript_8499:502-933(+)
MRLNSQEFMTQALNKKDVGTKLEDFVFKAYPRPKVRKMRKGVSQAAKRRNLEDKKRRSNTKQNRKRVGFQCVFVSGATMFVRDINIVVIVGYIHTFGRYFIHVCVIAKRTNILNLKKCMLSPGTYLEEGVRNDMAHLESSEMF